MSPVLNLVFTLVSAHAASNWLTCKPNQVCAVSEKNANFQVTLVSNESSNAKTLKAIEIKSKTTGQTETYEVSEVNNLESTENFELNRLVSFRPGVEQDLALYAYNSAREGKMFYYFLYDPKGRKFVMSKTLFPKLIADSGSSFHTDLQKQKVMVQSNLQLAPR